jgi:hypothetical protein
VTVRSNPAILSVARTRDLDAADPDHADEMRWAPSFAALHGQAWSRNRGGTVIVTVNSLGDRVRA